MSAAPALSKHDQVKGDDSPRSFDSKEDLPSTFVESIFDDPILAKFYEPPPGYESRHRFDTAARWTPEEEQKLVKKLDLRVTLFACICFAALQLDRGNIVQALSDNMLNDIGVGTNDYNLGQTIFYVSFLFAELPSQLISKALGVDRWIPFQMMAWSIVAISQYAITNKTGFFITRSLLGLLEGGFIPDIILYLSYFFTSKELSIRLSWFWVSLTVTTILASFVAAGLLRMRGINGVEGWRYLFLIEGLMTLLVGVFAAFYMPPSPTQTTRWFRKEGWFTEKEEVILTMRVLRDDPTKSSMHNRQHISMLDLWKALSSFDHFFLYALGLTSHIAPHTVGAYFSLTLRSLGFTTFKTNLLMIPSQVLFILNNLALNYFSHAVDERTFTASIGGIWQFIFMIAIVAIPDSASVWGRYAVLSLLVAYPYAHPILVSWNSRNSGSVRTRTVSASVYNITVQLSSIISSNIYRADDKPFYHRGNKVLLGLVVVNLFIFILTKIYFIQRNKYKRGKWEALSPEERAHYLATTKDEGNRRLDFVFAH